MLALHCLPFLSALHLGLAEAAKRQACQLLCLHACPSLLAYHACPFLQAWLKQLKGRPSSCSPFMLALLLVMSESLSRLQQPIMDQLQVGNPKTHSLVQFFFALNEQRSMTGLLI